jgi:hypothetical protein
MAMNVGNMIRRELRRRVPGVAKLESNTRRYTGKGLNNIKLPGNAKLPSGFKAPKGTRLVIPEGAEVGPESTDVALEDPDEKKAKKTVLIVVGIVMVVSLLVVTGFVVVPRGIDWWQGRGEVATTTTEATTTTTTTPVTTTVLAPVLISTWDVGACVTTDDDDLVRPSACDGADLTVIDAIEPADDELSTEELTEAQQILADLGVDITVDGILGKQTQTAIDAATLATGRPNDVSERVKLAIIRSLAIPNGIDPDGPRAVRTTPAVCGDGVGWVESPDLVLCLGSR